jgi:hypothetical protein
MGGTILGRSKALAEVAQKFAVLGVFATGR